MDEIKVKKPHTVYLDNRKNIVFTGITDVGAFDEDSIVLYCEYGEIIIKGEKLQVNTVNTDIGEVKAEGKVISLTYTERPAKKLSFFGKVFR
ncbi:MAG: sporulation protein YabP [Ruminococcaceae bacterium]|nr:sporulation protein YabP [Oscillospiraceae bacterium]MBR3597659.1 sporulation protein YabP [Clostridia bacterium]